MSCYLNSRSSLIGAIDIGSHTELLFICLNNECIDDKKYAKLKLIPLSLSLERVKLSVSALIHSVLIFQHTISQFQQGIDKADKARLC